MATPIITTTQNEIIIRIPTQNGEVKTQVIKVRDTLQAQQKKKGADWEGLRGLLADNPAFKGKTSVEVQHMIRDVWLEKYSS